MSTLEPTPERLLLTAILLTMSPKKRARVLAMPVPQPFECLVKARNLTPSLSSLLKQISLLRRIAMNKLRKSCEMSKTA